MTKKAHQPRLVSEPEKSYQLSPEEEARKAAYRERLRKYLQDPEFRATPGFPIADDEAILALSDPPYYTACPNPFLPEIIAEWQAERGEDQGEEYHREPFATMFLRARIIRSTTLIPTTRKCRILRSCAISCIIRNQGILFLTALPGQG